MKVFVFSLVIIAILCALTAINALVVRDQLGHISEEIAALPDEPSDVSDIAQKWERFRPFLGVTVRESVLGSTDSLFRSLKYAACFGDTEEYARAKDALLDMLDGIKCADVPYLFDSVIT